MSDDAIAATGGFFTELPLAISFLTILPVIDQRPRVGRDRRRFVRMVPDRRLSYRASRWPARIGCSLIFFAQVIRSVLIVFSLTVITGAVHLDGLADTADALGAGRDRERALDILHDSRVGTFGASAIFFDLTLKILALSTLAGHRRYAALIFAPMLARWAMVAVAVGIALSAQLTARDSTLLSGKTWRCTNLPSSPSSSLVVMLYARRVRTRVAGIALRNRNRLCDAIFFIGAGSAASPAT